MCTTCVHEVFGGPGGVVGVVSSADWSPLEPLSAASVVLAPLEPHAAAPAVSVTSARAATADRRVQGRRRVTAEEGRGRPAPPGAPPWTPALWTRRRLRGGRP